MTEKGIIDLQLLPMVCRECTKLLANTFVAKGDSLHLLSLPIYIFCKDCYDEDEGCLK